MENKLQRQRVVNALLLLVLLALFIRWRQPKPVVYPSFAEICHKAEEGSAARITVEVLLEQAGTEDCEAAQEWLVQQEKLDLSARNTRRIELSDLRPLGHLPNLYWLSLHYSQVSDIGPLADLPNLSHLFLGGTKVSDLTPLADLQDLFRLNLIDTDVSDLSPLANLPNLSDLSIDATDVSDLTPLANLPNLYELSMHDTEVSDLSPLAGLRKLSRLYLRATPVSDLCPIVGVHLIDISHDLGTWRWRDCEK